MSTAVKHSHRQTDSASKWASIKSCEKSRETRQPGDDTDYIRLF